MSPEKTPEAQMREFFRLLQQGNEQAVIELRALNYEGRKNNTFSGYFDQEDSFVAAAKLATKKSGGVYCTINVCNPQLLSRRANRATPYAELTTSDQDIFQRRYLPIDLDPERPAGTSSSGEQHEAAIERSHEFFEFMKQNQWNEPIMVDSGNGAHLLMPFDYRNDEQSKLLSINMLKGLAKRFNDSQIKVDESVFNAARIMRLPGTMNRKGDHLPKYPHRLCKLLHVPHALRVYTDLAQQPEAA